MINVKGARGVGKTTLLLQRLFELGKSAHEAVYFSLDDFYFSTHLFIDIVDAYYKQGGKYLFLDEVHKFTGWSQTVKNLYDFYPDLQIVFTGSSIIDIELHLLLRQWLTDAIQACKDQQLLEVDDPAQAADLIFVISDGAYYYLSMIDNAEEYHQKISIYKNEAFKLLKLENKEVML